MLARCLVPLPLPPTPSPPAFRTLLFRLHHLLSYPYPRLYFAATQPLRIVVSASSSLFIIPSQHARALRSSSFSSPATFSSSSASSAPDVLPSSRLFPPLFTPIPPGACAEPRLLCFFTVRAAFFRHGLVTRLHRSPLFASYGTLFAFLPSSPPSTLARLPRFVLRRSLSLSFSLHRNPRFLVASPRRPGM